MRHHTCTDCHQPIPVGTAVLRGNGHELLAWHRECFTLHRALPTSDRLPAALTAAAPACEAGVASTR